MWSDLLKPWQVCFELAWEAYCEDCIPIGAVVTDIGGIMSHAAIVCREYGLPAVTGTGNASSKITSGMRLRVDGNTGTVTILE